MENHEAVSSALSFISHRPDLVSSDRVFASSLSRAQSQASQCIPLVNPSALGPTSASSSAHVDRKTRKDVLSALNLCRLENSDYLSRLDLGRVLDVMGILPQPQPQQLKQAQVYEAMIDRACLLAANLSFGQTFFDSPPESVTVNGLMALVSLVYTISPGEASSSQISSRGIFDKNSESRIESLTDTQLISILRQEMFVYKVDNSSSPSSFSPLFLILCNFLLFFNISKIQNFKTTKIQFAQTQIGK